MRRPNPALSAREASRNLRPLRALAGYLAPHWRQAAGAAAALIVAASTVLAIGLGLRHLVDNGIAGNDPAVLDAALVILLGVIAVLAAATFFRSYLVAWVGERVVADLRRDVFAHILKLSPSFFEVTKTGEILSRLTTDTTLIQTVVGSTVSMALRNMLLFVGAAAMLLVTSPRLTGLVVLVIPLVLLPILVLGRRLRRLSRASQDRVADVGAHVEESISAVRTVQAFGHEGMDIVDFSMRVEEAFRTAIHRTRVRSALAVIVIVLALGAVCTILWLGGRDVMSGAMSAGDLSAFVFYAVVAAAALGALSEVVGDLQRAAGATERLMDLLAAEPEIAAPSDPAALPEPSRGRVAFEATVFAYPSAPDRPVLGDFDLDIAPGETVAVVGPSGAGKSTLFNLLLRFYDPVGGRITLDGVDICRAAPAAVRAKFGLVPQEPVVFSTTARENIAYGRPDASHAEIVEAAKAAAADEFLRALPEGYDSYLGERGVRLSAGQRQRLAIARAILRDPAVLLLDEATSALDSENERLIQDALGRLSRGRTTIVIAHRLATVMNADRIVVLDRGRAVATGTHDQLLAAGGLYARLAELQFTAGGNGTAPAPIAEDSIVQRVSAASRG